MTNLPFEIAAQVFAHQLMGLNSTYHRLKDSSVTMDWIDDKVGFFKSRETIEGYVEDLVEAGTLSKTQGMGRISGFEYFYGITERGILELLFYSPVSGSLREEK